MIYSHFIISEKLTNSNTILCEFCVIIKYD